MKQYNYIYKITNLINGKIYIGKHSTDRLDDGYMGSSRRVKLEYSAIGKENFEKTILAYSDDEEELAELERHYITLLNATDPDVGYNRQINSSRYVTRIFTEESKQKMSEAKKGCIPWNKGKKGLQQAWNKDKKQSVETKLKISEALKGKPLSEDTKQKMKGRIPWNKGKKGLQQAWNKGLKLRKESQI